MRIYAMSDIHGCLDAFLNALSLIDLEDKNNKLILCGDYIHGGYDSYGVVEKIMELKKKYKSRVIVLMGNHEESAIDSGAIVDDYSVNEEYDEKRDKKCLDFISHLELYYKYKDEVVFCHAGVDEEAGEYWEAGTADYFYTGKYPAETGPFCINIVAGHIAASTVAGNPKHKGVYYDGESHYFIDGGTEKSGYVPVLMYDTNKKKFYEVHDYGNEAIE